MFVKVIRKGMDKEWVGMIEIEGRVRKRRKRWGEMYGIGVCEGVRGYFEFWRLGVESYRRIVEVIIM